MGKRDEWGRYRIPIVQNRGQCQPRKLTKRDKKWLQQSNSVYGLPLTEEAIKCMHAVCVWQVKSTWIKAFKAGNFVGWPILNERNVGKYYPETNETPKGHTNQTRKNVQSTKPRSSNLFVTSFLPESFKNIYKTQGIPKYCLNFTFTKNLTADRKPFGESNTATLKDRKVRDIYTKV